MEPLRIVPPSPERIRYEREEDTRHTIDQRIHLLAAQEKRVQEAVQRIQQNPTCIPTVIQQLKNDYTDLTLETSPRALVGFLQRALQNIREQQNILYREQAAILAPLTRLHETIWMVITDQAPNTTKATLAQVSRGWKERTIASLKHEYAYFIQHKIDQYIAALTKKDKRDVFHSRETILQQVKDDLEAIKLDDFHDVQNFQTLKTKVFDIRARVLDALTKLDPHDFPRIPSSPAPMSPCQLDFPYNVFHLITQFLSPDITGNTGKKLAITLLQQGDSTAACRIANEMADLTNKDQLLLEIATPLATTDGARALEIANTIVHPEHKTLALFNIAIQTGRFDQALEMANTIDDLEEKDRRRASIAGMLAKTDIDRALEIAYTIDDLEDRDEALGTIASELATTDIDRALGIAIGLHEDLGSQLHALYVIIHTVAKTDIDRALALTDELDDSLLVVKDRALSFIAVTAATTDIDRALGIAYTIDSSTDKDNVLSEIASMIAKTNIDRALEIVNTRVVGRSRKAQELRNIASMVAITDIDLALGIATTIDSPGHKAHALSNIASTAATSGRIDRALEIANTIADPKHKTQALNNIAYMQEKIALAKSR